LKISRGLSRRKDKNFALLTQNSETWQPQTTLEAWTPNYHSYTEGADDHHTVLLSHLDYYKEWAAGDRDASLNSGLLNSRDAEL
jgi:hypothetical protein